MSEVREDPSGYSLVDELSNIFSQEDQIEDVDSRADLQDTEESGAESVEATPTVVSRSFEKRVAQRPALLDLTGRGLNSRKVSTEQGAISLKAAARVPGTELSKMISLGEISEEAAQALLDSLHLDHTVFVTDDIDALHSVISAAQDDIGSSAMYPVLNTPASLTEIPETIFKTISKVNSHLVIGTTSQGDPILDLHRLLLLQGSNLPIVELRQMLLPGPSMKVHRSKPRLRIITPHSKSV